jgi:hypothetical protein
MRLGFDAGQSSEKVPERAAGFDDSLFEHVVLSDLVVHPQRVLLR